MTALSDDTSHDRQVTNLWSDNVVLEQQFLADHPGAVIERVPGNPAQATLMRFVGRLGEQDGGGEVTSTDLGDVLCRLGRLAGRPAERSVAAARG
jgi:hypothetical protein